MGRYIISILPLESVSVRSHVGTTHHSAYVLEVDCCGKRELGQRVSYHVFSFAPCDLDGSGLDHITDEVIFDVDVLGLASGHGVVGQGDTTGVVLKHHSG